MFFLCAALTSIYSQPGIFKSVWERISFLNEEKLLFNNAAASSHSSNDINVYCTTI